MNNGNALAFAISINPNPLTISKDINNTTKASISIAASGKKVYCDEIKIEFSTGETAYDLTNEPEKISYEISSNDWSVTKNSEIKAVIYKLTPENDDMLFHEKGLYIDFHDIIVNTEIGVTTIKITQSYSKDKNASSYEEETSTFHVGKFPYGFYMKDFTAHKALIMKGDDIELSWSATANPIYTLIFDDSETIGQTKLPPVSTSDDKGVTTGTIDTIDGESAKDVTNVRKVIVKNVTRDTSFYLTAHLPSKGSPVSLTLNTNVMVVNPELLASKLTISAEDDPRKFETKNLIHVNNSIKKGMGCVEIVNDSTDSDAVTIANTAENSHHVLHLESNSSNHSTFVANNLYKDGCRAGHFESYSINERATVIIMNKTPSKHNSNNTDENKNAYALHLIGDLYVDGYIYSKGNMPTESANPEPI